MSVVQGLLFHVAADTGRDNLGIVGPIITEEDNRFEYIPSGSPKYEWGGCDPRTYQDLPARNSSYGQTLADFLPTTFREIRPHIDPEFQGYTYGEPDEDKPRINTLRKIKLGSILFFVGSLSPYDSTMYRGDRSGLKTHQNRNKNKYVIGFFKISGTAFVRLRKGSVTVTTKLGSIDESKLRKNHHYTRMCPGKTYEAIIWAGHTYPRSALLSHAIRLTERYGKHNYLLTSLGRAILARERDTLRGGRWVTDLSLLVDEILAGNPELTLNHPELKTELLDAP